MKDIKEKLVQASKAYSDQIVLRAAINAIPQIGGTLDILLSSSGQNFVVKRIEKFISELSLQIEKLELSKVNFDFFEKEECYDLIIKAINSASRTRQAEKLKLYAKIVKGALVEGKEYEEDDPEIFLRIIEEMSLKELKVAKLLYQIKTLDSTEHEQLYNRNGVNLGTDAALLSNLDPEFDEDDLISIFIRLERTGLIKEIVGNYFDYAGGLYEINPLFKKFVNFVEEF